MKIEKTGRLLEKTLTTVREQARTIADLRLEVAKTSGRIQDAVDAAVQATIAEWSVLVKEANRDRLQDALARRNAELLLAEARDRLATVAAARDSNGDALLAMTERAIAAEAKIVALAEKESAIASKEEELKAMVDKISSRMRRREVEEANAILNRQTISGLAPAPRRG